MEVSGVVAADVIGALDILAGNGTVSKAISLKESDVTLRMEVAYLFITL